MKYINQALVGWKSISTIGASVLTLSVLAVAPAVHAITPDYFCESLTNDYDCWNLSSPTGYVNDNSDLVNSNSEVDYYQDNLCSGSDTVTSGCPFVQGSGLNAALKGHTIVEFYFPNQSACLDATSDYDEVGEGGNCSGSHAAYIPVDNGLQFISVGGSNYDYSKGYNPAGTADYIAGVPGEPLIIEPTVGEPGEQVYTWYGSQI
jgi:hypothetical protein